ncbi:uncharacterized protein KQ657_003149 [Scheffersomyces spartinae]|uniref:Zn(2)-C6 fungal-type domain-containing protein n=1 Tax=Scheffersomyces spartinae TaxID=45513 RepID=A0A9P7V5B2_9ASCO|nr:uncharacterized protein KQ657_003149 [Scheffersomyces spartinae]KAG7191473.1 hypothetical protein KQ657_003149 [Scheffersomyces spartinae]
MFSLLEAGSLKKLRRKTISHGIQVQPQKEGDQEGFKQRKVKADSFVGTKSRSRKGCNACRRRKKRCDHVHPVCGPCLRRKEACGWSVDPKPPVVVDQSITIKTENENENATVVQPDDPLIYPYAFQPLNKPLTLAGSRAIGTEEYGGSNDTTPFVYEHNLNAFSLGAPGFCDVIPDLLSPFPTLELAPIPNTETPLLSLPVVNDLREPTPNRLPDISSLFKLPDVFESNSGFQLAFHISSPASISNGYGSDIEKNVSDTVNSRSIITESALDDVFSIQSTIPVHPYLPNPHSFLDSRGELFLNFYRYKVTRVVAVSGESSNYFVKSHLKFCRYDEAICNLVAAWGGMYLRGSLNDPYVQIYYKKAIVLFNNNYIPKVGKSRVYRFWVLLFYTVLYGLYVCAGDCLAWKIVFLRYKDFVDHCGGLKKVCEDYQYSNDIVFLMSLFQYTDITSSNVLLNGTTYPIEVYREVFEGVNFLKYGVDPVQGVFQPIYLRLGEIVNAKVAVRERRKVLERNYNESSKTSIAESLKETYQQELQDYNHSTLSLFSDMMKKVTAEQPCKAQLDLLFDDEREFNLQVDTFKTYQIVCQIYCYLFLKEVHPNATEVQDLAGELLNLIESLMESKMLVSMLIPLLTCGMVAQTAYDRSRIEQGFNRLLRSCALYNVETAREITRELWRRNMNGTIFVDWCTICEEKGWDFCAC